MLDRIIEESLDTRIIAPEFRDKLLQLQHYLPDVIIGGGAARQVFLNSKFGSTDIDIYHPNPGYQNQLYQNLIPHTEYMLTANAYNFKCCSLKIQLIRRIYTDNIEVLFNSYDFACCMFAIKQDKIYYTQQAKEDAEHKWLHVINNDREYLRQRVGKYLKKGYIPKCPESSRIFDEFLVHCKEYKPFFGEPNAEPTMTEWFDSFFGYYPEGY